MKKLFLFASVLMLSSITNKISAQSSSTDIMEATIISVSSDKSTGLVSTLGTAEVFQFVNNILTDVLPGDKVIIVGENSRSIPENSRSIPENSRSIGDSKKSLLSIIR